MIEERTPANGPSISTSSSYREDAEILADRPPILTTRRPSTLSFSTTINDETPDAIISRYGPIGEVDLASWGLPEDLLGDRSPPPPPIHVAPRHGSPAHRTKSPSASSIMDRPRSLYAKSLLNMDVSLTDQHGRMGDIEPLSPSVEQAIKSLPPASEILKRPAIGGKRTVSFGDYDAIVEASARERDMNTAGFAEDTEILADVEGSAEIERPRSSMGVMNRGRPTSPFRDIAREQVVTHDTAASYGPVGTTRPRSAISYVTSADTQADPHSASTDDGTTNPFSLPVPAGQRLSRFDPKGAAEARPKSQASMLAASSREDDPRRYVDSRRSSPMSLRPRTLVMPVPLQSLVDPSASAPPPHLARGFQQGAKPLPPGALTRSDSYMGSLSSSRLTPSQKIFSSSLPVDGQWDEGFIGGADRDGEIGLGAIGGLADEEGHRYGEEEWRPTRKVEGISLVDRLEARKAQLRNKQRCVLCWFGHAVC